MKETRTDTAIILGSRLFKGATDYTSYRRLYIRRAYGERRYPVRLSSLPYSLLIL